MTISNYTPLIYRSSLYGTAWPLLGVAPSRYRLDARQGDGGPVPCIALAWNRARFFKMASSVYVAEETT